MIPAEQLANITNMIIKNKKDLESHIKSFDIYRNAVQQERSEASLKFKTNEKEMKKLADAQSKITHK